MVQSQERLSVLLGAVAQLDRDAGASAPRLHVGLDLHVLVVEQALPILQVRAARRQGEHDSEGVVLGAAELDRPICHLFPVVVQVVLSEGSVLSIVDACDCQAGVRGGSTDQAHRDKRAKKHTTFGVGLSFGIVSVTHGELEQVAFEYVDLFNKSIDHNKLFSKFRKNKL